MKTSITKAIYAQSSDIKSRTFSEYRFDMKKKGIRELEFLDYLRDRLIERYNNPNISVEKHGADSKLWFLRQGGRPNQAPDYEAKFPDDIKPNNTARTESVVRLFEFQIAEKSGLDFFDFKVSKVGKKVGGERLPHTDREFFYVVREEVKYAFLSPEWILKNGEESYISAWRTPGVRVKREVFLQQFVSGGGKLEAILKSIDNKIFLLDFQKQFIEKECQRLSRTLQNVVDKEVELKIVPRTLMGMYEVCFFMEKLNKEPDAPGVWMVYLSTFLNNKMTSIDFARFMFAFDFIYFKCARILDNESKTIRKMIVDSIYYIQQRCVDNGNYKIDPHESLIDGISQLLFAVNLLEDIRQDAVITFDMEVPIVNRIFETIPDVEDMVNKIKDSTRS